MYRNKQSQPKKKKNSRKSTATAPVRDRSQEAGSEGIRVSKRRLLLIIGIVVVVILGILAVPYYLNYVKPFNQTIITVDGTEVSARYFLERTRLADSDPLIMLESLTNELVMKVMAPQYGIQVTDADIDEELKSMASGGTGDISDVEFNEWYRQQLNDNKASDSQYREIISINLLADRLQAYLSEQTPTVADQVHLHLIVVVDYDVAQEAAARLEAGEDFASVARDVSVESNVQDNGGDLGWVPPVIIADYGTPIASLEVNEVLGPMAHYSQTSSSSSSTTSTPDYYYIFMVSEKQSARVLDDDNLQILKAQALTFWLLAEVPNHTITYNFNSEIYAWLSEQLQESSEQ